MPPKKKTKTETDAKKAGGNAAAWEFKDDKGAWSPFLPEDCKLLEVLYQTKAPTLMTGDFSFNKGFDTQYKLDFVNMKQINQDSKKERQLRRLGAAGEFTWQWEDDMTLMVEFYDADTNMIEKLYQDKGLNNASTTKDLSFNKKFKSPYTFTFTEKCADGGIKGTQKNEESGKVRKILRAAKKGAWEAAKYGIAAASQSELTSMAGGAEAKKDATSDPFGVGIPKYWAFKDKGNAEFNAKNVKYELVEISEDGDEYKSIAGNAQKTIGAGKKLKIQWIKRVQNVTLYTFYSLTKTHIAKRNPEMKGGVERMLYFGERNRANMDLINQSGFDTRVAANGTLGQGIYFHTGLLPCDNGKCIQNADNTKEVYVVRVAVGMSHKGTSGIRRPPPKDPKKPTGDLYDCADCGKATPDTYVIFNNAQAYPEYVIRYTVV